MTKFRFRIRKEIIKYLEEKAIPYRILSSEENKSVVALDSLNTIYLYSSVTNAKGMQLPMETCIRFEEKSLYAYSYPCKILVNCSDEQEIMRAARIVCYLNQNLCYDCDNSFAHTYVFDEKQGDLYNSCLMRYELIENSLEDAMNHILNFTTQQLADVYPYITPYIKGELSYFHATKVGIEHGLKGNPIP